MSSFNDHMDEEFDAAIRHEAEPYSFAANQDKAAFAALINSTIDQVQDPVTKQVIASAQSKLIAKLYECVAGHYENGDPEGAKAILNAIQYAQQEN